MISRLNALYLSGSLALSLYMTKPIMADEANKRTELQFSAPVQIPGQVLAPGKYVFQLLDSPSDRNIVQVFSKDSDGNESLIATLFAISDYTSNTPDKTIINYEERRSGAPEAIHSWFYPGDNTGSEFVYPKGESLEAGANLTAAPAPLAAAAAPSMPAVTHVQQVQEKEPVREVAVVEEQILFAQNDAPAPPPAQETDIQTSASQVLPQTGGNSDLELMTGFAMLGGGLAALFASRRKSKA